MLTTYGPGSFLDLVHSAVMVSGLEFWGGQERQSFDEPRLAAHLRMRGMRFLRYDNPFCFPPSGDERQPDYAVGVDAVEFPLWFVCPRKDCRMLRKRGAVADARDAEGRYKCTCDTKARLVPVRFVLACPQGHVQEFPWRRFVHDKDSSCQGTDLRLEEGVSGDFSEVRVSCRACGSFRPMSQAKGKGFELDCEGRRPWLADTDPKGCDKKLRLLVRSASNSYFSLVASALSIPQPTTADEFVEQHRERLANTTDAKLSLMRGVADTYEASFQELLLRFTNTQIVEAIERQRENKKRELPPLRDAEYRTLMKADPEEPGRRPKDNDKDEQQFFARALTAALPAGIARVVLLHRLREVRVQTGFTRIDALAAGPEAELGTEHDLLVKVAPLAAQANWLPGIQVLGEGIFLSLDMKRLAEWEARPQVIKRVAQLRNGYQRWAARREKAPDFFGPRFYLLHTLSHLLVSALSLECGYAASAIKERIYCSASGSDMAGILLSTGAPGSEGTLGGLVEEGRNIRGHLAHAYDMGSFCSNDPVCAAHDCDHDPTERHLEGAACHGCVFIAEPSCEHFNKLLDRSLVFPVIGQDGVAFFQDRP